jgi:UDP-glucose 4-epimerase
MRAESWKFGEGLMRIVVTGGSGYIGSVAVQRLVERGDDVVVFDNLGKGHCRAVPDEAKLEPLDIEDGAALSEALCRHRPEAVLHFAALTIAPDSVRDPGPYWRVNAVGTLHLLEAMRQAGVATVVLSSTAAVYGNPPESPISEDAPLRPINPYGASKLAAERIAGSFVDAYGMRCAALRYFNVAGATAERGEDHRPETHLIPRALAAALDGAEPLTVYGTDFPTADGTAIRDYVHVADLIDAHLLALDRMRQIGESLGPINLGTRAGASVREVLAAVERVTGKPVPAVYADRRPGDPAILIADATRASEMLGWSPRRSSLDEMIASTWAWRTRFPHGYA